MTNSEANSATPPTQRKGGCDNCKFMRVRQYGKKLNIYSFPSKKSNRNGLSPRPALRRFRPFCVPAVLTAVYGTYTNNIRKKRNRTDGERRLRLPPPRRVRRGRLRSPLFRPRRRRRRRGGEEGMGTRRRGGRETAGRRRRGAIARGSKEEETASAAAASSSSSPGARRRRKGVPRSPRRRYRLVPGGRMSPGRYDGGGGSSSLGG